MASAIVSGGACTYRLEAGGRARRIDGPLEGIESVRHGSSLTIVLSPGEATGIEPGSPVELELRPGGGGDHSGRIVLWCERVREELRTEPVRGGGARRVIVVEACDPLAFATEELQFRSAAGGVPLLSLVAAALDVDPGPLEELRFDGGSPVVPWPWVFQAEESTREFVTRVASSIGQVVLWNRDSMAAFACGRAADAIGLVDVSSVPRSRLLHERSRGPAVASLAYSDGAERRSRAVAGASQSGAASGRLASAGSPSGAQAAGTRGLRGSGDRVRLISGRADLRVGGAITIPGGRTLVVEEIRHRLDPHRGYSNEAVLVEPTSFALEGRSIERGMLGPYHAVVTHDQDPERRDRVRVRLLEDPEARPGPWLPVLVSSAGEASGVHWPPATGQLVLVAAAGQCPEALTVLGAVRSNDQRIPAAWSEGGSKHTVLAGSEAVHIEFDDRRKALVLTAGKAQLRISDQEGITLNGREVHVRAETRATVSGERIELG